MMRDGQSEMKGHPMEGLPFIGFDKIVDKGHQLTITNSVKRSTHNKMRLPVCIDDMASPGGTLKRYLLKVSPGQQRFYCRKASVSQRKLYTRQGFPNAQMSYSQPIGVNKIAKMMKAGCYTVGLKVTGHGLRWISTTTLVNDSAVNIEESLVFAQHTSVAAQRPYIMCDAQSEMKQFRAQGLVSNVAKNDDSNVDDNAE